jgi:uncharacterized membrane protein
MKTVVFGLITFAHDLFTAVWIGGMFTLALSVFPALKGILGAGPETKKVTGAIQKRHSVWAYISMAGLILTGLLMANRSEAFSGLFTFQNPYTTALSLKHILVLGMVSISLYRSLILGRGESPSSPSQKKRNAQLLIINLILGMGVLLLSGLMVAWA